MAGKSTSGSPEAQDKPETGSVYDFLYHDARRVGSFLAQLSPDGQLLGYKRSNRADKGSSKKDSVHPQIGSKHIASLGGVIENASNDLASNGSEETYDPFWTNALQFLDLLQDRGLIHEKVEDAAFGQFVLVRGWLRVLDLAMFKDTWALPTVRAAVQAGQTPAESATTRNERRIEQKSKQPKMPTDVDLMLDLLKGLPHTVHASIVTEEHDTIWASLREEYLVTQAAELGLTHGVSIPGEWAMLGILSGRPDPGNTELHEKLAAITADLPAGQMTSVIGSVAHNLAPMIRTTLGRPTSAYAVTPMMIFREVT